MRTSNDQRFYSGEDRYLKAIRTQGGYASSRVEYCDTIYTVQGDVVYPNESAFNEAVTLLSANPMIAMRFGVTTPPNFHLSKNRNRTSSEYRHGGGIVIARTKGMMTKHILLHELAHYIVYVTKPERESHGPEFRRVLGTLIQDHVGQGNADLFRALTEDAVAEV